MRTSFLPFSPKTTCDITTAFITDLFFSHPLPVNICGKFSRPAGEDWKGRKVEKYPFFILIISLLYQCHCLKTPGGFRS